MQICQIESYVTVKSRISFNLEILRKIKFPKTQPQFNDLSLKTQFLLHYMVSEYFSESSLKSALSKAKHEFDLAAEMVQLIEQGMVQTHVGDR